MSKKVVLITGAAKRVGKTIAEYFIKKKWRVAFHYNSSQQEIDLLRKKYKDKESDIDFFKADLSCEASCHELLPNVKDRFGRIDCLINNSSVFINDNFQNCDKGTWDAHMQINLRAPFILSQRFAELSNGGNIVNIIDECVLGVRSKFLSYSLSKSALLTLTKILAASLAPNFRVNAIAPGPILPSIYQSNEDFNNLCLSLPLQTGTNPDEIAQSIYFLVEKQQSMTGQLIVLDGGESLVKKK